MVEMREFFQGGEILKHPLVLIGFVILVLYLVVKVLKDKFDSYAASDVSLGLLVVVGIVVVLGFSLQFFQSCNPKGYFVVAVFASSNKNKMTGELQKLKNKGFSDVNYIWVQERQLFQVYVGKSHQCLWECEKINELKKSIITKTSYKDAYIWRLPSK